MYRLGAWNLDSSGSGADSHRMETWVHTLLTVSIEHKKLHNDLHGGSQAHNVKPGSHLTLGSCRHEPSDA